MPGAAAPFLPALHKSDSTGAPAVEQHPRDVRAGFQPQVGAPPRRAKVGGARGFAQATPGGDLVDRDTFVRGAVDVVVPGQADLVAGAQVGLAQRMHIARHIADVQRTTRAAHRVRAMRAVFHGPEIGQHVLPRPTRIAQRGPVVEIARLPAHEHHRVDAAGAAQHLAARPITLPPGQRRVGLGAVHPVDGRVVERLAVTDRRLEPEALVAAAGFQQQHGMAARRREPIGQHTAGGSGTHHNEIKLRHSASRVSTASSIPQALVWRTGPL